MTRLRYEGGKFGIYEGSDNLPLGAPRSYLSRTKIHSDLGYVALDPTPLTATFQVVVNDSARKRELLVGYHGKGFVPFVKGFVTIGGYEVPLDGSVPVYVNTVTGDLVLWTLAVSATQVIVHEQRSYPSLGTGLSYPVTVYISNLALA